ncbi:MAG: site-2 protease family protein, partial [Pedosphaera parvula]|nr:site-2 protease family protein [Pedosphaera parvula]
AGLVLGLLIFALSRALPPSTLFFRRVALMGLYINFFWTFVNLLPIQPLDGGQILRELLGPRRQTLTSMVGFVLATLLCVWALLERNIFTALLLGMLAYYNFNRQAVEGGVIKD